MFKLYSRGQKLRCPEGPFVGDLLMQHRDGRETDLIAQVAGVDEATLPLLYKATIKKVSSGGLEIRGTESVPRSLGAKSNADHYRQVWWALTEDRAVASVRLKQLQFDQDKDALVLKQINTLCAEQGWNDNFKAEASRLEQAITSREALMQSLRGRITR